MKIWSVLILAALWLQTGYAQADCYDDAGALHKVNPWVLRAIADVESKGNPMTVNDKNSNNTVDRGLTGTNSVHLPELARYGITATDLFVGCKSIYVGAWYLRKKVNKYGAGCKAIGAYHSETSEKGQRYVQRIRRSLAKWGIPLNC